jgi:hypothetical protein
MNISTFDNLQVKEMSWRELNTLIHQLSELQLLRLLNDELNGLKRATILIRLHQRYTIVRATRERLEILRGL